MTNEHEHTEKGSENKQNEKPAYEVITHNRHETVIKIDDREYQLTGLKLKRLNNFSFTMKLTHNSRFCLLDVNLSRIKSRNDFIDEARETLFVAGDIVRSDIDHIMELVETRQREAIERIEAEQEEQDKTFTMSEIEEAKTVELLSTRDVLFKEYFEDMEKLGYKGDFLGKKVNYLAITSRMLPNPLAVLAIGKSSGGKSFGQRIAMALVPDDKSFRTSRLTPQALSHFGKHELMHGVLGIDEMGSLYDETRNQLRTMLSEGKFILSYPQRDARTGEIKTVTKEIFGPFTFFSSTTDENDVDDETLSRMVETYVDESQEQTKNIFKSILDKFTEGKSVSASEERRIRRKYQLIQKVLRPLTVKFPRHISDKIHFACTKQTYRRLFSAYITIIQAIALHRQYLKKIHTQSIDGEKHSYIKVALQDVLDANEIMKELVEKPFSDLSPVNRQLIEHIIEYCAKHKEGTSLGINDVVWTRKDIRNYCGWAQKPVERALNILCEMEYIAHFYGGERGTYYYKLNVEDSDFSLFDADLWKPADEEEEDPFFDCGPYLDDKQFLERLK